MDDSLNIAKNLQEGKWSSFINFYEENKNEFIADIKEEYQQNTYQAADTLRKSALILLRYLHQINLLNKKINLRDTFMTIARSIVTRNYTPDKTEEKELYELIEKEIKAMDTISDHLENEKNNLDDTCRKLLILIYYQKFPLSKTSRIMGINDEDELIRLKEKCLAKISSTGE